MAKVTYDITANDKASPKLKGLTKSLIGAQLATAAIIAGTKKLIAVGKQAVENFKKQELAEAKLQAAVGGNIDDLKKFASEMQNVTTVGDETTLEILQLASSMGTARDSLAEVAEGSIGLAKSLALVLL